MFTRSNASKPCFVGGGQVLGRGSCWGECRCAFESRVARLSKVVVVFAKAFAVTESFQLGALSERSGKPGATLARRRVLAARVLCLDRQLVGCILGLRGRFRCYAEQVQCVLAWGLEMVPANKTWLA
eukprot:1364523-Lingulodinium_polyedra.AAC.1